jgi:hydroxypyruvate reductase
VNDDGDLHALLRRIFLRVAARIDGERLVAEAAGGDPALAGASHVLAIGKVALPMLRGLPPAPVGRRILAVVPAPLLAEAHARGDLPEGIQLVAGDHPTPTARSVAAAAAALTFVQSVIGRAGRWSETVPGSAPRLLVLLSGGASSLLCAPADGIGWEDKRDAIAAVARAGAPIGELNAVRKHLSALKGGQLALATAAPIAVRALSDVIGDDPATIGSGPFSPDPSTFAQALAIVERVGVALPAPVRARLERGARGEIAETPKPPRAGRSAGTDAGPAARGETGPETGAEAGAVGHVDYRVLAGPTRVVDEALAAIAAEGLTAADLPRDTEDEVEALAEVVLARARQEIANAPPSTPRIWVGNGEPRVVMPATEDTTAGAATGRGGRATHLALCVARGLAALPEATRPRVAFLAAGTDDRDGNSDVSGAIVDGTTWWRARAGGLDPGAALRRFDSLPVLAALGDTLRGPGTSNLLDLHLLVVG